ncbi:hypothetical protein Ciccas_004676 [Cichlidogyrus casuarinus]|uniref:Uncharacterized protein n=1 Tax=Cichlidogyrus casuarinus TaxID=1844966 RepID=A0ABD2QBS3_9PLAT
MSGRVNGYFNLPVNDFDQINSNGHTTATSGLTTSISDSNGFATPPQNSQPMFGSFYQMSYDSGYSSASGEIHSSGLFTSTTTGRFGSYASATEPNGYPHSPPDRLATRAELQALSNLGVTEENSSYFSIIGMQGQQNCNMCQLNHRNSSYSGCSCSCHGCPGDTKSPLKPSNSFVSMAHNPFPSLTNSSSNSTSTIANGSSRFGSSVFETMQQEGHQSDNSSPNTSMEMSGDVRSVNLLLHDQKPLFT